MYSDRVRGKSYVERVSTPVVELLYLNLCMQGADGFTTLCSAARVGGLFYTRNYVGYLSIRRRFDLFEFLVFA